MLKVRILDWYIVREHIAPFLISNALIMFIFTLNLALRVLGRIVGQGLELTVIVEYFFLNLAWIITLAVPMSVLVACLMAFGRLAGDREVVALKSAGVGIVRMIAPVIVAGVVVAAFALYFQDQILPDMNHRNKLLTSSIRKKKPSVALREGIFTHDLPKQTLLVRDINEETGLLTDVTIFDESDDSQPTTVIATTGRLVFVDTLGMYHFYLQDGEIHQLKRADPKDYQVMTFEDALYRIEAADQLLQRREQGYRGDRELGLAGLRQRIERLEERNQPERFGKQINKYRVEYHKKYAISAAAIVFVLVGAPLGIKLTRGGLGVSGPLAVLFFLVYWVFLIGGEDIADRGIVDPWMAMWAPNVLLSLLGILLIRWEMRQHSSFRFPWQRPRREDEDMGDWSSLSAEEIAEYAAEEKQRQVNGGAHEETEGAGDSPAKGVER